MVGTIEPRKGYDQALEALEQLWDDGIDVNLVLVGHFGWLMEPFRKRLEAHAQYNRCLFWIDDVNDDELDAVYRASTWLLAASWGEGYGLPLIEAALRNIPVIARDLPVFREVMGEHAQYFRAQQSSELADVLRNVLSLAYVPPPAKPFPTWQGSAASLSSVIKKLI
jgi:glycosyltransferase involved in cell wall biosynthesis